MLIEKVTALKFNHTLVNNEFQGRRILLENEWGMRFFDFKNWGLPIGLDKDYQDNKLIDVDYYI